MWIIRTFLILILIALIVGFVMYNSHQQVTVDLFGKQYTEVRMIHVIFYSFVIGMLVSFILLVFMMLKSQRELRDEKRENKRLLEEITTLRNMPLEDLDEKADTGI